jgi:hypothetical protein
MINSNSKFEADILLLAGREGIEPLMVQLLRYHLEKHL